MGFLSVVAQITGDSLCSDGSRERGKKRAGRERRDEARGEMSSARDMLVHTLAESAMQIDQRRVQHATQQLEVWRTHPGFFSTLQVPHWHQRSKLIAQEIFLDPNAADDVRFQSIIYIKNHLDRYWRRAAKLYAATYFSVAETK